MPEQESRRSDGRLRICLRMQESYPTGWFFLCSLAGLHVAGRSGDPLFHSHKCQGEKQEFAPEFAAIAIAEDGEAKIVARVEEVQVATFKYATHAFGIHGGQSGFAGVQVDGENVYELSFIA